MDHSSLKTAVNERKFIAQVFIQHHRAVRPYTAILRLTRAPLKPPHPMYGLPLGLGKAASKHKSDCEIR